MASSNMRYMMRSPDGKEYGPVDQETLVKWGENGRVTTTCLIRNTMIDKWHPAKKLDFIAHLVVDDTKKEKKGKKDVDYAESQQPRGHSLVNSGLFKYVPAGGIGRLTAWVADLVVLAVLVGVILAGMAVVAAQVPTLSHEVLFLLTTVVAMGTILFYFTLTMGIQAQTMGQWFAGLMVLRSDGGPVLIGRAFAFTLCHLLLFWSTPLFLLIMPKRRALHDLCCDLRVVRITLREPN